MPKEYPSAYGAKPLVRPDPGIVEELKQEAVEDTAEVATDAALKVAAGAKTIAEEAPKTFNAAMEHPVKFGEFSIRSLDRYIRHKPWEAMTLFAGFAFLFGSLWGIGRRERDIRHRVVPYHHGRLDMVRPYADTADDKSEQASRTAGYADRAVDGAKEYASDAADRVLATAKDAYDDPQRFVRENRDRLTRYTQEKPLEALAIAAGIAFVVGAIWKR